MTHLDLDKSPSLGPDCVRRESFLDAAETAALLPYAMLVDELAAVLRDPAVQVHPRSVLSLPGGGGLFVMPALDQTTAISKLITFTPANAGTGRPTIQGDVIVFDIPTGARTLVLHGQTVTARRTAAVSALAARQLSPTTSLGHAPGQAGPLLIIGAGVQGHSHLEAFVQVLGVSEVFIVSRGADSANALAEHARALGASAQVVDQVSQALPRCPLVVTCTPARAIVLDAVTRPDTFIAAVGAFTPDMAEIDADLCRRIAARGHIVLDSADARHEAGDLLQADIALEGLPTLRDALDQPYPAAGPVLFKSCGWAGWDLAAARLARRLSDSN